MTGNDGAHSTRDGEGSAPHLWSAAARIAVLALLSSLSLTPNDNHQFKLQALEIRESPSGEILGIPGTSQDGSNPWLSRNVSGEANPWKRS